MPYYHSLAKTNLPKARKDLATKDEQIARLKEQIKQLQAERAATVQRHQPELAKLRNGYQTEIAKAIKEADSLRKTIQSKDARIEQQSRRIAELVRPCGPPQPQAVTRRVNLSLHRPLQEIPGGAAAIGGGVVWIIGVLTGWLGAADKSGLIPVAGISPF